MKSTKIISLAIIVCMLLAFTATAEGERKALRFGDDGTFTILHITDPQDDANTARRLRDFLKKAVLMSNPDLVVFTGDMVEDARYVADFFTDSQPFFDGVVVKKGGKLDYEKTLENVKTSSEAVFSVFEELQVPFVVAQGNNDYKAEITNEDWLKIYSSYPHCLNAFDMSPDSENHLDSYICILSSESDEPAFGLWLLDNGQSFNDEQAEWMKNYPAPDVPSIAFEHKPAGEMGYLFKECSPFDKAALLSNGKTVQLDSEKAWGHAETVVKPGNSKEFPIWQEKGVVGAFFGHTHTDGYTGIYEGITLGLTYGCEFSKLGPYGVRTISINENDPSKIVTQVYVYSDSKFTAQEDDDLTPPANAVEMIYNLLKFILRTIQNALKF